jgi:hypothetical protein
MSSHAALYPSLRRRRRTFLLGRTAQHLARSAHHLTRGQLARELARAALALAALAAWAMLLFLVVG